MSFQACNWAVTQQVVSDPAARHVLLVMANYAGVTGDDVWLSAARIARETGLSVRTVRYKVDMLEKAGLISPGDERILAIKFPDPFQRPQIFNLNLKAHPLQILQPPANGDIPPLQNSTEPPAGAAANKVYTNQEASKTLVPSGTRAVRKTAVSEPKYTETFEAAWKAFPGPRKGSKAQAMTLWKSRGCEKMADTILADIRAKASSHRPWLEEDGRFIPMMTTYLSQRRWTEEIDTTPPKARRHAENHDEVAQRIGAQRQRLRQRYIDEGGDPDQAFV